jgi:glycosyltransferase involved in cell wall biosynthesis
MIRVLHVYSGNLYGGVESLLIALARCAAESQDCHEFALCFDGRLSRELAEQGAAVHDLGAARVSRPWTVLRARRRLSALLWEQAFDCVVCHSPWSAALFGGTLSQTGQPLILYLHGMVGGVHWTERWAARMRPTLVIAVSQAVAESARRVFEKSRFEVLHNPLPRSIDPLDESQREAIRKSSGVLSGEKVIILVSRMEPLKGHTQSLSALAKLAARKDWRCWVVGGAQRPQEQRYLQMLKEEATRLGIADRVHFLGERQEVPQLLGAADIFLQANAGPEGFGIVFMEALVAKLPVVTMRMGGTAEMLDETCACLLEPQDIGGVAAALARLLDDSALRQALGESGRRRVLQRHDPQAHLARLSGILHEHARLPSTDAALAVGGK